MNIREYSSGVPPHHNKIKTNVNANQVNKNVVGVHNNIKKSKKSENNIIVNKNLVINNINTSIELFPNIIPSDEINYKKRNTAEVFPNLDKFNNLDTTSFLLNNSELNQNLNLNSFLKDTNLNTNTNQAKQLNNDFLPQQSEDIDVLTLVNNIILTLYLFR